MRKLIVCARIHPMSKKQSIKPRDVSFSLSVLKQDSRLKELIERHGEPDFTNFFPASSGIFQALLRSIVYQQISGKAAASIYGRFVSLYPRKKPTPELVLATPEEQLRARGLSTQKIKYIKDTAQKFFDGTIQPRLFSKMTSEEIVKHLIQIKGVGVWTAHMLLIFTLNRLDVLPIGDLAIRKAFQKVYNLRKIPNHRKMEELAKGWREHASVASWYLWQVIDEAKKK